MTSLSRIELGLRVGPLLPGQAPAEIMRALRGVEVTQADTAPSGFQLTFLAELLPGGDPFAIVQNELLSPFSRVVVRIAVDGVATTLIDGFVTHHQYMPGNGPDDSLFVVTGEDVSVQMSMIDYSLQYPSMPDDLTVLAVLGKWAAIGILADVPPAVNSIVQFDSVSQQRESDRALLQRLAEQNGNVFYVSPTDLLFVNSAYWGPPQRTGPPQALLDVAVGAASTADSFQAEFDALAPTVRLGYSIETIVEPYLPLPVISIASDRQPPLASRPALGGDWEARVKLWCEDQLDPVTANSRAQSMTNASTDSAARAVCQVSPARLGTVVTAPGVVGVRGTGDSYDGLYYLKSATHQITLRAAEQWDYTQSLTMTREGVGTTMTTMEAL